MKCEELSFCQEIVFHRPPGSVFTHLLCFFMLQLVVPKCCPLASNPCIEGIFRIIFITKEDEPQKLIEATEATSDSYPELILLLALLPSHQ